MYSVSLAGSSIYLYVGKGDTWFFLLASANLGQVYQSGQIVSFPVEGMERRLVEGLDASGRDWGGGGSGNHNYLTRYYLAATKHVEFSGIGTVGVHVAWVIGKAMSDVHYSRPAAGVNFHFGMKGEGFWQKALNGFNLMAEVCPGHAEDLHTATYTVNVGGTYSIWKDHINLIAELNDGKYFSGGIFFKLHLK